MDHISWEYFFNIYAKCLKQETKIAKKSEHTNNGNGSLNVRGHYQIVQQYVGAEIWNKVEMQIISPFSKDCETNREKIAQSFLKIKVMLKIMRVVLELWKCAFFNNF